MFVKADWQTFKEIVDMKKKIIAWILWIVGIGYIIFSILTGGLFIAVKEDTYVFTLQESRGAYFLSPMLPIHLTQIKVPFVFWYLFKASPQNFRLSKFLCSTMDEFGEKSCLGIGDKISSVELFSVNYIMVDQQQYNLLSLSYPGQSQFVLHEKSLVLHLPEKIQNGDTVKIEGKIHFKDGEEINFSSLYTVKKYPADFQISLLMFNPPSA